MVKGPASACNESPGIFQSKESTARTIALRKYICKTPTPTLQNELKNHVWFAPDGNGSFFFSYAPAASALHEPSCTIVPFAVSLSVDEAHIEAYFVSVTVNIL